MLSNDILRIFRRNKHDIFLVLAEEPVGYYALRMEETSMKLESFGVIRSHRGRGVGEVMMRQIINHAKKARLSTISLTVDASNEPAISLYEKHGFVKTAEEGSMMTMTLCMREELGE